MTYWPLPHLLGETNLVQSRFRGSQTMHRRLIAAKHTANSKHYVKIDLFTHFEVFRCSFRRFEIYRRCPPKCSAVQWMH